MGTKTLLLHFLMSGNDSLISSRSGTEVGVTWTKMSQKHRFHKTSTWVPPRPLHFTPASWNLSLWENPTSLCWPSPHSKGQEPSFATASTPAPRCRSCRTSAPFGQSTIGPDAPPEQVASWFTSCGSKALPQTLPRVNSPLVNRLISVRVT